jgi:16S rRNA (guanine966-N2)-methyltransferase
MTRIVAGAAGGRRLAVPVGSRTRPTSDRAREGLFSTLQALLGSLAGARFLDLYAGSGAVGLEALSRGAAHVLMVEAQGAAARTVRANAAAVGLPGAEVRTAPVERTVARAPGTPPYGVVFLDPPFDLPDDDLRRVLVALHGNGWLTVDALAVVERAVRGDGWSWPEGFTAERSRRYGEAGLWYGRAAGQPPAGR